MGSLDFAVQLRSSTFDVSMADALIFDVPVELGLELVAVVGSDLFDAERELFDDVIDEVDRVGLSMFVVDFERPDARRVIDSSILEPADLLAALADEGEELDVHLDVMAWHLLVITLGVNFAHPRAARQPANAVTTQNARHACVGDFDAVISRQIPDDPDRSEMISAAQVKDLLHDLGWRLVSRVLWNGLCIDQPGFAALLVGSSPAVEA